MNKNNKLFELVSDKPLNVIPKSKVKCPYCGTKEIQSLGTRGTLVGGNPDPNHYWNHCRCKKCDKKFTKEYKRENVWYTDEVCRILLGVPSCFESYVYSCKKCGFKHSVHREYRQMDGVTKHTGLLKYTIGSKKQHQRCFYVCKECGAEIEYPQGYWS